MTATGPPANGEANVGQKRQETMEDIEPPLKKARTDDNATFTVTELGFNDGERFIQGQKLSSMAAAYASSTPYSPIEPLLTMSDTSMSSYPISWILNS